MFHMKNDFLAVSFEYISVLDSYFIHRYIIIKSSKRSIKNKIHKYNVSNRVMAFDFRIGFSLQS